MPCHTRMKTTLLQGLLWLCLLNFGMVVSLIEPGYLDFDNLPDTNFSCVGKVIGGYYADLETSCQMFHVCTIGQLDEPMDIRFLCLNGTVFDQETRVCERVDEVDCSKSEKFYHLNLELYGNTAPPIVEEPDPTVSPSKQTTSSTTIRTTTTSRTTRATFPTATTTHSTPKIIDSHQFPVHNGPDIRFNPEEINIRLTPGSPPIIKAPSPSVSYQQQAFPGIEPRITVTTHTSVLDRPSSTQKPKYEHKNYNEQNYHYQPLPTNRYQQTENSDLDYNTEVPGYSYHDPNIQYEQHTDLGSKLPTTKSPEQKYSTTSFSPSKQQVYYGTDKPLQIPQSLIPTLPPLTFSSPAPFTLTRHYDQKRSNEHHEPPRVIVSASASVSDGSGRRLNYSLGTIGATHLLGTAPASYDDYRESDVGLDPFYHDVPKVNAKNKRHKRETNDHWVPPDYVDDNYEPLTYSEATNLEKINETDSTEDPKSFEFYEDDLDINVTKNKLNEENVSEPISKELDDYDYYEDIVEDGSKKENNKNLTDSDNSNNSENTTTKNIKDHDITMSTTPSSEVSQSTTVKSKDLENINKLLDQLVTQLLEEAIASAYPKSKRVKTVSSTTETNTAPTTTSNISTLKNSHLESVTTESNIPETTEQDISPVASTTKSTTTEYKTSEAATNTTTAVKHEQDVVEINLTTPENILSLESRNGPRSREFSRRVPSRRFHPNVLRIPHRNTILKEETTETSFNNKETTITSILKKYTTEDILLNKETTRNTIVEEDATEILLFNEQTTKNSIPKEATRNSLFFNKETPRGDYELTTISNLVTKSALPTLRDKINEYHNMENFETANREGVPLYELTTHQTEAALTDSPVSTVPTLYDEAYDNKKLTEDYLEITTIDSAENEPSTVSPIQQTESTSQPIESTTHLPEISQTDPTQYSTVYEEDASRNSIIGLELTESTITTETTPFIYSTLSILNRIKEENLEEDNSIFNDTQTDNTKTESLETESQGNSSTEEFSSEDDSNVDLMNVNTTPGETTSSIEQFTTDSTLQTETTMFDITTEPTTEFRPQTTPVELPTTESSTIESLPSEPTTQFTEVTLNIDDITTEDAISTVSTEPTTTESTTTVPTTTARYNYLRTREPTWKRTRRPKPTARHRFSSPTISMSPSVLKLQPKILTTEMVPEVTDPDLSKSANPTESKIQFNPTTPITRVVFMQRKLDKNKSFNCLSKKMNRFYEDPRDCRLFHYCTPGFSDTQVLDMKFVCDFGTYFDVEKLICTKQKPTRCK